MLTTAARIYRETRKKHDQLFNVYVMRPRRRGLRGGRVPHARHAQPGHAAEPRGLRGRRGRCSSRCPRTGAAPGGDRRGRAELLFDCADGMLARFKKLASKTGHLVRLLHRRAQGGAARRLHSPCALARRRLGFDARLWDAGDPRFLLAGIAGVANRRVRRVAHELRAQPRASAAGAHGRGPLRDGGAPRAPRRPHGPPRRDLPAVPEPLPEPPLDLGARAGGSTPTCGSAWRSTGSTSGAAGSASCCASAFG